VKQSASMATGITGKIWTAPFLLIVGIMLFLLNLAVGAVSLPILTIVGTLSDLIWLGPDVARDNDPRTFAILMHIRLPRAVAAILAGSALAVSGAAMQGLFRNPMASPDIMGISAGAALGAVLGISLGVAAWHPMMVPLFSVVGSLITAVIVFFLAGRAGAVNLLFIILAGLALSSLLGGAISAVLLFSQEYEVAQFIFWTMGGLEGRMWQHVLWPAPWIVGLMVLALFQGRALNLLSQGEENAHGIGLNVRGTKVVILILTAGLTSLAISISGPIGFIGLMVPHLVRIITGPDHRSLLPLSAIAGAIFVLFCDLIGRWLIAPHEIKVGIITSIVGGSYFIYLIIRTYRQGRWL